MAVALPSATGKEALRHLNHATNGLIETYPDNDDVALQSSGSANTYGSYVEVIAADAIAMPFALVGFVVLMDEVLDFTTAVINLASGAASSEVSLGEFYGPGSCLHSGTGYQIGQWVPFPNPILVQANTRISARAQDNLASIRTQRVALVIQKVDNLIVGQQDCFGYTDRVPTLAPAAGDAWPLVTAGSADAYGSWVQLIASTTGDNVIAGVHINAGTTWDSKTETMFKVQIGLVEVAAATVPFLAQLHSAAGMVTLCPVTLPVGVFVPAGTEIKARVKSNNGSQAANVCVQLYPHPFR